MQVLNRTYVCKSVGPNEVLFVRTDVGGILTVKGSGILNVTEGKMYTIAVDLSAISGNHTIQVTEVKEAKK